jgi:hypothetical protein
MSEFALFYDTALQSPTPYHARGSYFAKALDRMDRTFEVLRPFICCTAARRPVRRARTVSSSRTTIIR